MSETGLFIFHYNEYLLKRIGKKGHIGLRILINFKAPHLSISLTCVKG